MRTHVARAARWMRAALLASATASAGLAGELTTRDLPRTMGLPPDCTTYIHRMGWNDLKAALVGTVAEKALADDEAQAFFAEMRRVTERKEGAGPFSRFVLLALHENLVISARPPTSPRDATSQPAGQGVEQEAASITPRIAEITPSAESRAAFSEALDDALETWPGEIRGAEVEGRSFKVLGDYDRGVHILWHKDTCYWAVSRAAAAEVASPAPVAVLSDAPLFKDTVGPLLAGKTAPPIALYYHDFRTTWAFWNAHEQGEGWKSVSWHSLDAVAGATFVENGAFHNRHYWKIGGERGGLFKHSQTSRIDPEWLKRIPADATSFSTGVWDAQSLAVSLATLACSFIEMDDDADEFASTIAPIPQYATMLTPITSTLGSRYLIYRVPGRYANVIIGPPLQDAVVVAERMPQTDFLAAFDSLTGSLGGWVTRSEIGNRPVRVISALYWSLYVVVDDDVVFVSMNAQVARDAAENWRSPGPSLVDSDAFRSVQAQFPKDSCFLMYFAPGGFARGIMDEKLPQLGEFCGMMRSMSGMFSGRNAAPDASQRGFDELALPRGRALARHVSEPTYLFGRDDGQGVLFEGRAPLLSTAYYWPYLYALTYLHEYGNQGLFVAIGALIMPSDTEFDSTD